jgi:NAD(P)H-dependent FMN reductase
MNPTILVIMGSTRPRRIGPTIARWVADLGRATVSADFEIIDLRDWSLPMDDEPGIPAHGGYEQEHTLAWSRKISSADGFIFVTPQFNWGYPASLKNAIDHLYTEWREKAAMIVTYGGHGGGRCAQQLRQVLSSIKMKIVEQMPALTLSHEQVERNDGIIDPGVVFVEQKEQIIEALKAVQILIRPHLMANFGTSRRGAGRLSLVD